jgi:hypothetical protein
MELPEVLRRVGMEESPRHAGKGLFVDCLLFNIGSTKESRDYRLPWNLRGTTVRYPPAANKGQAEARTPQGPPHANASFDSGPFSPSYMYCLDRLRYRRRSTFRRPSRRPVRS